MWDICYLTIIVSYTKRVQYLFFIWLHDEYCLSMFIIGILLDFNYFFWFFITSDWIFFKKCCSKNISLCFLKKTIWFNKKRCDFIIKKDLVTHLIGLHNSAWLDHKYEVWDLDSYSVYWRLWCKLNESSKPSVMTENVCRKNQQRKEGEWENLHLRAKRKGGGSWFV